MQPLTWPSKRERDTLLNESPALRKREPTWMGSCTHMPMIPTAWLSSENFRAAIHAMTFVTCTPVQTFGGWPRAFSKRLLASCRESSYGFTEKGEQ